jgi:hypothetical protein
MSYRWIFVIALAIASAGCSGPCDAACDTVNELNCASCDCSACGDAPASCDDYFDCINDSDSCFELGLGCTPSASCSGFVDDHCG